MQALPNTLAWEDAALLQLRALYETYGYRRYRMGKFEPYDLYRENRNFLVSDSVITFTDAGGRLMALKPDVTMSIVKNTQPDTVRQKLHYNENVFRLAPGTSEYREIRQIGLEYIGCAGGYDEAETVLLALKSLEIVSPEYLLAVSHMGLISGILADCGFSGELHDRALEALRHRNLHELAALADAAGTAEDRRTLLLTAAALSEPVLSAAEKLRRYELRAQASEALDELAELERALAAVESAERLVLDLTVVNDMAYYNGIVFQGYIQNVPRAVLTGGRYDNLLRRFGKPQQAMGFALYIGELSRIFTETRTYDADILLVCGDADPAEVLRAVTALTAEGYSVLAAPEADASVRTREVRTLTEEVPK